MSRLPWDSDSIAAAVALGVLFYSLSDGNAGHLVVQCALLLAGGVLVYEVLADLLDRLL